MQVAKWGNSLAVRLPADLVRKLDIKEGDSIELHADKDGLSLTRNPRPEEILAKLRQFRGRLPASKRLTRDEAHAR